MAKRGEIEKGISLLKEGLQKNPRSARANFELGKVLFKTGQLEDAERLLLNSANLEPIFRNRTFSWASSTRRRRERKKQVCTGLFSRN